MNEKFPNSVFEDDELLRLDLARGGLAICRNGTVEYLEEIADWLVMIGPAAAQCTLTFGSRDDWAMLDLVHCDCCAMSAIDGMPVTKRSASLQHDLA